MENLHLLSGDLLLSSESAENNGIFSSYFNLSSDFVRNSCTISIFCWMLHTKPPHRITFDVGALSLPIGTRRLRIKSILCCRRWTPTRVQQELNERILCSLCSDVVEGFRRMGTHIAVLIIQGDFQLGNRCLGTCP